jgi:Cu(I)/Ag(I) efflux system membrane fusion protein
MPAAPAAATMPATPHAVPPMSAAPVPQYQGTGRLEKVGAQSITLSHEPIPALAWPAMTMDFMLASPLPAGLQAGQLVDFSFSREGKRFRIESIEPARHHEGAKP